MSITFPADPPTPAADTAAARRRLLRLAVPAGALAALAAAAAASVLVTGGAGAEHGARGHGAQAHGAATTASAPALRPVGATQVRRVPGGRVSLNVTALADAGPPSTLDAVPAGAPLRLRFTVPAGAGEALPRLRAWTVPSMAAGAAATRQPVSLQREATVLVDRRRGQVAVPNSTAGHDAHAPGQGLAQTMPSGGYAAATKISAGASAVAVDAGGRLLAVAVPAKGRVELVDLLTGRQAGAVATGGRPSALSLAPDGRLWVADTARGRTSVIDPARRVVVAEVSTGAATGPIVFGPHGAHALATGDGGAALLDGRRPRVLETVQLTAAATGAGWTADGAFAVGAGERVTFLRPGGAGHSEPLDLGATAPVAAFGVAPGGQRAVAAHRDGKLTVIDLRHRRVVRNVAAGSAPAQIGFLGHFALVRDARAPEVTWVDLRTPSRSNVLPLGQHAATSLTVSPDGRRALLASPGDQKVFGLHVMMGRPMLMQADPNTARADTVLASGGGLLRTGERTLELRTVLQQPGAHHLELQLPGGGRARFDLPVRASRPGGPTARPERARLRTTAGEPVTVAFRVSGAAPSDAQVLAYRMGASASQIRVAARRAGKERYVATLMVQEPGAYRVQLTSERANFDTRSRNGSTLEVTP